MPLRQTLRKRQNNILERLTESIQGALECQELQTEILRKTASKKAERKKDVKLMVSGLKVIKTLVIDDKDDVYLVARDKLGEVNGTKFVAKRANSANDARSMCDKEAFSVILLRIGDEQLETLSILIRELKRKTNDAAIIAYSHDDSHSYDMAALKAGASDFLSGEEINAQKLEKSIRYCLRNNC